MLSKPTLIIMAAGMGSRYGGLKQMDPVGPNDELILDYSIYDALQSGFGKVVFVIKESLVEGAWLEPDDAKMLVGKGLAEDIDLSVGDLVTVRMITSTGEEDFSWNAVDLEIKGIFDSGHPNVDNQRIIIPLRQARESLSLDSQVTEIVVRLNADDNKTITTAQTRLKEILKTLEEPYEVVTWKERQILTRSSKYALSQTKSLHWRLYRAQEEIAQLHERKQGKPRLETKQAFEIAVEKILDRHKVNGLLNVVYETTVHERPVRKYGDRPARIERHEEITVSATLNENAVEAHVATLGWRVYATNAPLSLLPTDDAVVAYREQYTQERAFGRLKGKPLSLTPMYLEKDDHATGLVRLLSLGLRILSSLEFCARRSLQQTQTEIHGLYAGNPKRATNRPTAERLLAAFKDIILTVIREPHDVSYYLTPLSDTQSQILALLGFDDSLYLSLVQNTSWLPPAFLESDC